MRHPATPGLLGCLLLSAVLLTPCPAARASTIAVAEGDTRVLVVPRIYRG